VYGLVERKMEGLNEIIYTGPNGWIQTDKNG
jgi:hypothetical protein